MAILGITREYLWYGVPMVGFCLGWYLDRKETERMSLFRNKSALYGRTLKEGEPLPWP